MLKEFLSPSKTKQKPNFCNSKKVTLLGLGIDCYRFARRLNLRLIARIIAPIDKWPRPQETASLRCLLQALHFISCLLFSGLHLSVRKGVSALLLRLGFGVARLRKGPSLIWGGVRIPLKNDLVPTPSRYALWTEQRSSKLALDVFCMLVNWATRAADRSLYLVWSSKIPSLLYRAVDLDV